MMEKKTFTTLVRENYEASLRRIKGSGKSVSPSGGNKKKDPDLLGVYDLIPVTKKILDAGLSYNGVGCFNEVEAKADAIGTTVREMRVREEYLRKEMLK